MERLARHPGLALAALLLLALLTRAVIFGNPLVHNDEQFYLLIGSRMLDGALPYVDIWDRKPLGLFLLYAFTSALGPWDNLQYQLAAALSAGLTAWLIYRLARLVAPAQGALFAGAAYLLYLLTFNSIGGQTPVFYNLPMAAAALWTAQRLQGEQRRGLLRAGCAIMLLAGLAMQIKYTALFEGIAFGLALLWRARRDGSSLPALAGSAALWVACALAPTAAAYGYYLAIGAGETFLFANFYSIFGRDSDFLPALGRLAISTVLLTPFWLAIFDAPKRLETKPGSDTIMLNFMRFWAIMACLGLLAVGTWYDHYIGPLLVPLSVLAARALGSEGLRRRYTLGLLAFGLLSGAVVSGFNLVKRGARQDMADMLAIVQPRLGSGCLYIHEGDTALYQQSRACIPTRFAFPTHLNSRKEQFALGIDTSAEMRRILASRPSVIVKAAQPVSDPTNAEARALLDAALARNYELVGNTDVGTRALEFYALKAPAGHPVM